MDGSGHSSTDSPAAPISLPDFEAQITELARHLNAATYRCLILIAEIDRRRGWVGRIIVSKFRRAQQAAELSREAQQQVGRRVTY